MRSLGEEFGAFSCVLHLSSDALCKWNVWILFSKEPFCWRLDISIGSLFMLNLCLLLFALMLPVS